LCAFNLKIFTKLTFKKQPNVESNCILLYYIQSHTHTVCWHRFWNVWSENYI